MREELERDAVVFFDGIEDDDALEFGDVGDLAELLDEEAAVSGHVGDDDFYHEVVFTADDVEFDDFGEGGDLADEFAAEAGGVFFENDVDEEDDKGA